MEAIVNTLIKATGWSIFHSLWQGAIVYGILLLIVYSFPKLNAKTKHNMAYGALCIMFIGFCVTFFSLFKLPSASPAATLTNVGILYIQPDYQLSLLQQLNNKTENLFPYLVAIYALGLIFQLFILGKGYTKLARLKKGLHNPVPKEWQDVFQAMVLKLNLHQKISFYLSANVNVPLVIGYLKPVVLFPVSLATQLDIAQVEAILIHELSHIRRNDYLLNMIKTGIETILFFNPFIWLSGKLINIEREHACDDLVLSFTGTPITYAHALLKLEILKDKSSPAFAMASTGNNQHLYQRIKRITDMKTNYMNAKQKIFTITLTMATVISLAWVSPTKTGKEIKTAITTKKTEIVEALNNSSITNLFTSANHLNTAECEMVGDTTKKKKTVKIITVDANGNKKEYNSLKDVPDSLKLDLVTDTSFKFDFKFDGLNGIDSLLKMNEAYLKSPGFKALMAQQTELLRSPKFKAMIEEQAKFMSSPKFKAMMDEQVKFMDSKEFKALIKSTDFSALQFQGLKELDSLRTHLNSETVKEELENLKKLKSTPEYKKLKEKFDKDMKELSEKKGLQTPGVSYSRTTYGYPH
ncbi:MAG: M56 family metallopeptidase [Pedobacter sp.]|nr:MAG: M56 family metallopeptidase [Pedobacter sp.]